MSGRIFRIVSVSIKVNQELSYIFLSESPVTTLGNTVGFY
jgi:hypothetical protein